MRACSGASAVSNSLQLYSLPGSSVHRIFQARILEWVTISSSRDLPAGIEPVSSAAPALTDGFLSTEPPGKPQEKKKKKNIYIYIYV